MSSASFFPSTANVIRSPQQAARTFTQNSGFAKQKNVFLVRFITTTTGPIMSNFSNLTFAVKTADRPKVDLKTETLNEYNKKRVVHTGFKLDPMKISFYDSADGAAVNMFASYAQYYYGDLFNEGTRGSTNFSYSYDATSALFRDFAGSGFGFTGKNGPLGGLNFNIAAIDTLTADSQWFFDRIELYHFYDGLFDVYYMYHPKITTVDLGDVDYSSNDIATVNMNFMYENLQFYPQNQVAGEDFPEFQNQFNGDPVDVTSIPYPSSQPTRPNDTTTPSNPLVASLLPSSATLAGLQATTSDFRYSSAPSTGPISIFGSFNFGPAIVGNGTATDLSTLSLGNPALTNALNIGADISSGANQSPNIYNVAQLSTGLNPAIYDATAARVSGASTSYGKGTSIVTTGLLAAKGIDNSVASVDQSGAISLPPSAFGAINAKQTGTAQYGFGTLPP